MRPQATPAGTHSERKRRSLVLQQENTVVVGFKTCHQTSGPPGECQDHPAPAANWELRDALALSGNRPNNFATLKFSFNPARSFIFLSLSLGAWLERVGVPVVKVLGPYNDCTSRREVSKFMIRVKALAAAFAAPRQGVSGCPFY